MDYYHFLEEKQTLADEDCYSFLEEKNKQLYSEMDNNYMFQDNLGFKEDKEEQKEESFFVVGADVPKDDVLEEGNTRSTCIDFEVKDVEDEESFLNKCQEQNNNFFFVFEEEDLDINRPECIFFEGYDNQETSKSKYMNINISEEIAKDEMMESMNQKFRSDNNISDKDSTNYDVLANLKNSLQMEISKNHFNSSIGLNDRYKVKKGIGTETTVAEYLLTNRNNLNSLNNEYIDLRNNDTQMEEQSEQSVVTEELTRKSTYKTFSEKSTCYTNSGSVFNTSVNGSNVATTGSNNIILNQSTKNNIYFDNRLQSNLVRINLSEQKFNNKKNKERKLVFNKELMLNENIFDFSVKFFNGFFSCFNKNHNNKIYFIKLYYLFPILLDSRIPIGNTNETDDSTVFNNFEKSKMDLDLDKPKAIFISSNTEKNPIKSKNKVKLKEPNLRKKLKLAFNTKLINLINMLLTLLTSAKFKSFPQLQHTDPHKKNNFELFNNTVRSVLEKTSQEAKKTIFKFYHCKSIIDSLLEIDKEIKLFKTASQEILSRLLEYNYGTVFSLYFNSDLFRLRPKNLAFKIWEDMLEDLAKNFEKYVNS